VFLVIGVVLCALRWGFLGAVVGFVIGTFAGSALSVGVVRGLRPPRPEPARVATREMLRFGLWGLLTNVLGMALTAADVLCLSAIVGDPAVVGVYSIAVVFQQMVRVPLLAYLDARFPEMARSAMDKGALRQLRRRMRAHLVWVAVPSCAGVAALAPWLIPFLFGSEYAATVPILQLLLASHVAFALGAAQGRSLLAQGYVEGNFWASLIAAAANLALLLALIPAVGAFGAAAATVVSQAIWALATQWLCVRHEASLPG
jgi:O-antigen/teichoic acid export membrane protein